MMLMIICLFSMSNRNTPPWTEEEDAIIRQYSGEIPYSAIVKKLPGRTLSALYRRGNKILPKDKAGRESGRRGLSIDKHNTLKENAASISVDTRHGLRDSFLVVMNDNLNFSYHDIRIGESMDYIKTLHVDHSTRTETVYCEHGNSLKKHYKSKLALNNNKYLQ